MTLFDNNEFEAPENEISLPTFDEIGIEIDESLFTEFGNIIEDDKFRTRYIKPPLHKGIPQRRIKYRYAADMARDIKPAPNMCAVALIDGSFIAGDFIEAFITENDLYVKHMSVSTLSFSQDNVDSIGNLMFDGFVDYVDLIVSDGFFAHERGGLIHYAYHELDKQNRFQLAVARCHTKICLLQLDNGQKYVIEGSANLRSSGCIEALRIEENAETYDFYRAFHDEIVERYKTVNKDADTFFKHRPLKRTESWQRKEKATVPNPRAKETAQAERAG